MVDVKVHHSFYGLITLIQYVNRNIVETPFTKIIHGCNARGKMGSGVALAIRNKWPQVYQDYKNQLLASKRLNGGTAIISVVANDGQMIVIGNLITQLDYGRSGTYANLKYINDSIRSYIERVCLPEDMIASPKIGCGLGGLSWDEVLPIYQRISGETSVNFTIYSTSAN